ncbi:glycosyltransferase [Butyrivibrio sp. FCS014]|uniref:glycosyltransferase n=1 Tax=Butyrivibrio sp. FCS014 TaxID=1408304 RepID=UPI0018CBF477|nr:glycosyltransferase [Butyrivibrio sp. FCS014]
MKNTATNGKKHIAMYIGSLQKGGAERVMSNLADYFFEQGYRVTLVTTYLAPNEYEVKHAAWKQVPAGADGGEQVMDLDENPVWVDPKGGEKDGIERVFSGLLPSEQKDRLTNFSLRKKKLRETFKQVNPDVILSFMGKNNIMALSTATKDGYKVVVSVRADPDMEYSTAAMKSAMLANFGKAAGVVVQSNGAKEKFPKFIQKKCVILPNSMDPSFVRERGKGAREKKIVMVARLNANKNQALVMEAFKDATAERFQDYILELYGDGPDRLKLQRHAMNLGIENKVVFKGNVKHVAEHIEKAKLFILASDHEGMPNSLIEAMSLGVACISTDCPCGGPRDLITDGVNGLLVPVQDKKALTEAIVKILENDVLAENLGIAATRVQRTYAPDVANAAWKQYMDSVIGVR